MDASLQMEKESSIDKASTSPFVSMPFFHGLVASPLLVIPIERVNRWRRTLAGIES